MNTFAFKLVLFAILGVACSLALVIPHRANALTLPDTIEQDVVACLSPAAGTSTQVTQQICTNLVLELTQIIAQLTHSQRSLSVMVTGVPMDPIAVGKMGNWTVQSSGANPLYAAYWGDGSSSPNQAAGTFSHAYQSLGTFTPYFAATTNDGGTGSASAPAVTVVR